MQLKKVVVVCYKNTYGTETALKKILTKLKIKHTCINRDKLSRRKLGKADLIITVGGDGTFLRTSQHVLDTPVFTVASSLKKSEGFFSRASRTDLERKIKLIIAGKYKITKLNRLESTIRHGKKAFKPELAVNEVKTIAKRRNPVYRMLEKV